MDVEKSIEFLVNHAAQLATHAAQADARQDRFEQQLQVMARLGMRVSRRAFSAIEALAVQGRATEASVESLTAQVEAMARRMDALGIKLDALIASLNMPGGNGRSQSPPSHL